MMKYPILVTGGNGFIGSHLVNALTRESGEIHVFIHIKNKRLDKIKDKIKIHKVDLLNFESLKKIINEIKPKTIFHLAALVNPSREIKLVNEMINVNFYSTINLLNSLQNIDYEIFVNTGTCEEYGDGEAPFKEDQLPRPVSPYSASKVAATFFCQMYCNIYEKPIVTLRPFLTYGPGQDVKLLIPSLITKILRKENLELTKGEQTRDFIFIDDVVDAYIKAAQNKNSIGEIINIGSGNEYKIKDVVNLILKLMDNPIKSEFGKLPYRKRETMHFYADNSKAKKLLGWSPKVELEDGLRRTIDYYKNE